ncbi:menaquinone biosynthetic enzyme MqnA/MqnD family protein [Candidatus Methylomirabilis limnetica]|uniref:menaquinone biosynthetic enzyme MqnA/MqnD family protein n=1 Tax=Candidatus Methylomirabilis limnetica TaxID=2033718 RepID=UPI0013796BA9|nr:menaquinone biosynthesis protein [Candidatus Methylomirabilis limnetica]
MKPALGKVAYINCEPVYYGIEQGAIPAECRIVEGTPAELNGMLRAGDLDLSVISAIEYACHSDRYLILPDLAIGSDGPTESVLLLSRVKPCDLDGKPVRLSRDSLTSVFLVKLLLAKAFGVRPRFLPAGAETTDSLSEDVAGVLMIGDPALRARGQLPFTLDLGQGWKELTGLPFVFAVWAVRRDFYRDHRDETHRLHRALLCSKRYSLARLDEICEAVCQRVRLNRDACATYLKERLSFDLTPRHLEGLRLFFTLLEAEGELKSIPPLEFIDAVQDNAPG